MVSNERFITLIFWIIQTIPVYLVLADYEIPYETNDRRCSIAFSNLNCSKLPFYCLNCNLSENCTYGENSLALCTAKPNTKCNGRKQFNLTVECQYCHQTYLWQQNCGSVADCNTISARKRLVITNCSVYDDVFCFGPRVFEKKVECNWTKGKSWSLAMFLSLIFGGFGGDRFYLGHWREGIGKLFSFGGLGLWTVIDCILIAIGYLSPDDTSLYL